MTPAILAKRRGSVPHVVRVQNLPYSPDRIRNKGSPVKTPPTTAATAEASVATSTATKGRKKVGPKGRRKLAGLSEAGASLASTTATAASRGPPKSKKRKLDQEAATESVQEVSGGDHEPVMKKSKKPLSVKFDDDDDRPKKKAAKTKAGPRLANSPQRLSSIPVEVCIETLGSSSPAPQKRGRKPKKISPKKTLLLLPEIAKTEKPAKGRPPKKVPEDDEPEPSSKSIRSTRSNEGRTTRSKDWSWEKVLLINPDKITKKKI